MFENSSQAFDGEQEVSFCVPTITHGRSANSVNSTVKVDSGKMLIVYYSTEWCGPCRRLHEVLKEKYKKNDKYELIVLNPEKYKKNPKYPYAVYQNVHINGVGKELWSSDGYGKNRYIQHIPMDANGDLSYPYFIVYNKKGVKILHGNPGLDSNNNIFVGNISYTKFDAVKGKKNKKKKSLALDETVAHVEKSKSVNGKCNETDSPLFGHSVEATDKEDKPVEPVKDSSGNTHKLNVSPKE